MIRKDIFYKNADLPKKFLSKKIEDFEISSDNKKSFEKFLKYRENLNENLENGRGLAICGPVGVGKTALMTMLAKEIIDLYYEENKKKGQEKLKFKFIQSTTLFDMSNRYGLSENQINFRNKIKEFSGLFIDDLTKFGQTNNGNELIYLDDIIRYRDLNMLPTFYTMQVPLKNLQNVLTNPIQDIIRGNCEVINLVGESHR